MKFILEILSSEKIFFFVQVLTFRRSGCINNFSAAREMSNHEKPVCARAGLVHMGSLCCSQESFSESQPCRITHCCLSSSSSQCRQNSLSESSFPYSCFQNFRPRHKWTFRIDLISCCQDKMLFPEKSIFVLYNLWGQNKIDSGQRLFVFRPEYNCLWFQQLIALS